MYRQPVKEIEALREREYRWENIALKPGDNPLADVSGDLWEMRAEIEPGSAAQFGFDIGGHKVQYDVRERKLSAFGRTARLATENGRIKLHLLVDRTSVEIFGNDGKLSMSSCFLPRTENKSLGVFAIGGTALVTSLKVYRLRSAWH
jgi:sucrose-6-phosphate hydrolase SacC (GH32 family)